MTLGFKIEHCNSLARKANALFGLTVLVPSYARILWREFVTMLAVSFTQSLNSRREHTFCRSNATSYIFLWRHWFQMAWIHATAYAAQMIKFQPWRDRANEEFVTNSVGRSHGSIADMDTCVSPRVTRSHPNPAACFSDDLNAGKQALNHWTRFVGIMTGWHLRKYNTAVTY